MILEQRSGNLRATCEEDELGTYVSNRLEGDESNIRKESEQPLSNLQRRGEDSELGS